MSGKVSGALGRILVWVAGLILAVVVLGSLGAQVLTPYNPNEQNLTERLKPPAWSSGGSAKYLLGTDPLGRDLLARVLYGGRITLVVGLAAVAVSATVGIALGLVAGYYRGAVDDVIMRLADVQLAVPVLMLAVMLIAVLDITVVNIVLVLGLGGWVTYARVVRSLVLSLNEREFIQASRALGASNRRILLRHILPNVAVSCLVVATLEMANMIILEAALSFLGLGVRAPAISWGGILGDGRDYMTTAWWVVTFPGVVISLVILSVNLLGDALRDRLDPGLRS